MLIDEDLLDAPTARPTKPTISDPLVHAEARNLFENRGLSPWQIEKALGMSHNNQVLRASEREGWVKFNATADEPEIIRARPPDPFEWIKTEKIQIMDKSEGGGWVQFKPWESQRGLMKARIDGKSLIGVKGRQIGVTTCLQIADLYSLINLGPFHCHWVAKDQDKSAEMLREIRETIERAKFTDAVKDRMTVGGKTSDEIWFRTERFSNYIRCHAPTPGVARGFPGNCLLLDEAAYMPYSEDIYTGFMGMFGDVTGSRFIISTPNAEDVWFQTMYRDAKLWGLIQFKADWRCRPDRNRPGWRDEQLVKFGGREDLFEQEYECSFVMPNKMAFNVEAMMARSSVVPFIGGAGPQPGHIYVTGGDQSMSGEALTVSCTCDASVVPAQVVCLKTFVYDPRMEVPDVDRVTKARSVQKAEFFDTVLAQWPGQAYIDGTNEEACIEMMKWPQRVMIKFRGEQEPRKFVRPDGIVQLQWPRPRLIENAVKLVEAGRLVVNFESFPQLYDAFKTAHRYHGTATSAVRRPGIKQKRQGKRNDELDAFLLMALALTDVIGPGQNGGVGHGAIVAKPRRGEDRHRVTSGRWKPKKQF